MELPRFLQRPILISVSPSRWKRDVVSLKAWPSAQVVLNVSRKGENAIPFVIAAGAPDQWPGGHPAALGASILKDLHPAAVEAIADVAVRQTGMPVLDRPAAPDHNHVENGRALASWFVEAASNPGGDRIRPELPYLFASGAHRARAIATVLGHIAHRPINRLADNGAAIGMISWLLSADLPELNFVQLVEPEPRFRSSLDRLWRSRRNGLDCEVVQMKAERAAYSTGLDMILFCHCLICIEPAERRVAVQRAWAALPPGGVLVINEALRDSGASNPRRPNMMCRADLMSIMPGRPQLFTQRMSWAVPEDLSAIGAAEIGYSGILVSVRE